MTSMPPTPDEWRPARFLASAAALTGGCARTGGSASGWSFLYGSFILAAANSAAVRDDGRFQAIDWHGAHLWAVSIGILILSVADAFLTVTLVSGGAVEVNPFMAAVMGQNIAVFAILKIAMTGVSVMLMVFLARYRFMRVMRVEMLLYGVLVTYLLLIGHEMNMLHMLTDQSF